jgi:hypothetical protein
MKTPMIRINIPATVRVKVRRRLDGTAPGLMAAVGCVHPMCYAVHRVVSRSVLSHGPENGFSHAGCLRIVKRLPLLLCESGQISGLTEAEEALLRREFVTACLAEGAEGLNGQSQAWYAPLQTDIKAGQDESPAH